MPFWAKDLDEEAAMIEKIKPFDWKREFPSCF
jgi:hypothetical protein